VAACNGGAGFYVGAAAGTVLGPGNWVGTRPGGAALGNLLAGVLLYQGAAGTEVISSTLAHNRVAGLRINGANASVIAANEIFANIGPGIEVIVSGQGNVIGGPWGASALGGNTIWGNTGSNAGSGVLLNGSAVTGTVIVGNFIGTQPSGLEAAGNDLAGITLVGAAENWVGYPGAAPNVVSGNAGSGLVLDGASRNHVVGNWIGLAADGHGLPNRVEGVLLLGGASGNVLEGNVIAYNALSGVRLFGAGTVSNTVQGGAIHHNGTAGVWESGLAENNAWLAVPIYANYLGIEQLVGPGGAYSFDRPRIEAQNATGPTITVSGRVEGTPLTGWRVDLYGGAGDPSGFGQGAVYLGTTVAGLDGTWSVSFTGSEVGCYAAIQTRLGPGGEPVASSAFGPHTCRVLLPQLERR
jgi:hypothetical protein